MSTKNTNETLQALEQLIGEKLTLGSFMLAIRQGENLTQVEFARLLGISKQVLCDIEHNRRAISPKKAASFADTLGYSRKQFVQLCLQDMLDRDHLGLVILVESAA